MNKKQHLTAAFTLATLLVGAGIGSVKHSKTVLYQAKKLSPLVQEKLQLEYQLEHCTYVPADVPPLSNAIAEIRTSQDYARQAHVFQELNHKSSNNFVIGVVEILVGAFIVGSALNYERKRQHE